MRLYLYSSRWRLPFSSSGISRDQRLACLSWYNGHCIHFFLECKDDGSVFRHEFRERLLDKSKFCHHLYQAFMEWCLDFNISPADIKYAMSPIKPRLIEPTKFDHDAMRLYLGWIPVDRIIKTIRVTSQFIRMPSSTYLRRCLRTPYLVANIIRQRDVN